jgi:hypothetical protein
MISRVFKPRRLRTAGSPSGKSREEPVDGQVPPIDSEADSDIDEVDLGEPLSRVDTVDTFVSIYSSTPLVDKA